MRIAALTGWCVVALLAACGGHDPAAVNAAGDATSDAALPKPEATGGSVTGMPSHPGPGQIGPQPEAPTDSTLPLPPDADTGAVPEDGAVTPTPTDVPPPPGDGTGNAEPGPADAAAVIRDYYRSIEALDYAHAWSLWSDGGRSSGQTPQQFADGFADTAHVSVDVGPPGPVGAAAGSRYVQVPVTLQATARDGSVQHYAGSYTLRRAVVDGATPEQRAWHIATASLRPVQP